MKNSDILNKELVWWRDVPVDVEIGLLTYLCQTWKNKVYVISANGYAAERKLVAWENENRSLQNVELIYGKSEIANNSATIQRLLDSDAIHVFSGIKGGQKVYLDYLNKKKEKACVLVMESTSKYGNKAVKLLKGIAYPMQYSAYYIKYKSTVKGVFAMGASAVNQYSSYGWKNVFDFMYLPSLVKREKKERTETIRILYIGRFDFPTKGMDVLMKAIDMLGKTGRYKLDLVGGYGNNKDEVINWTAGKENVEYIGKWDSNEVVEKMTNYDVCVVPSKCDGWNLAPLQCLHAGIGCIVTDNAGSQELIEHSMAGVVIPSSDEVALLNVLQKIIKKPEIIDDWSNSAKEYVSKVSVELIGQYFIEALEYCFGYTEQKPTCPW